MTEKDVETQPTSGLHLKAIIDATPECIKIVAADGALTFINQAGLEMLEAHSFKQVENSCVFDVISAQHRERWIEMHHRVCRGERLNWQFEITGLNGTKRFMDSHAVPLLNSDGTYSQLSVTRNITERKRTEEALHRNEIILTGQKKALELAVRGSKLAEVLDVLTMTAEKQGDDNLFASILLVDTDGKHLLHGSAPHLPHTYNLAIDGIEIGPSVGSCGTAAFTGKEVIVSDIQTDPLWKDFKDLAIAHGLHACWSTPILSSQGRLLATFALYYPEIHTPSLEDRNAVELLSRTAGIVIEWHANIVERNRVKHELTTTESHLSALVAATSDVIYRLSADWTVMGTLDGKNFLKDAHEPVVGWRDVNVHKDHREMVDRAIEHAIKTKSIFQLEHKVNRADGSAGWTFSRAIPILDSNGEILEWFGAASDITERKDAEEKLKLAMNALEDRVAERTKELNQVNQALKQSNEDLLQFAHVASHDLKEPVRKIKTFGYRLEEELNGYSSKAKEYLNKMMSSASRMAAMIDGVLAYSTVNATTEALDTVNLNTVFEDIKNDLEIVVAQKNATIQTNVMPDVPGNRFLLYQLFYNLINNSLKFAKPDVHPLIQIGAEIIAEENNRTLRICIQDNGIGFSQANAIRIFDTFARLHPKDKFEGTGLGLALCKKIVHRHRGQIQAFGEEGKGATIVVTLPMSQQN